MTAGRLEFTKGAAKVNLRGDGSLTELYRASFEGPAPEITVNGGIVTVQQRRRFRPFDWRTQSADFALATAVPWDISLRGGMWKLVADFSALRVTALEVTGGASDIEVTLPAPVGIVPVRISGGASEVLLRRPAGTEARAEMNGGASQLIFDGQRLGAVGGRDGPRLRRLRRRRRPLRDPLHRRREPGDGRDRLTPGRRRGPADKRDPGGRRCRPPGS